MSFRPFSTSLSDPISALINTKAVAKTSPKYDQVRWDLKVIWVVIVNIRMMIDTCLKY
jgi:hypothetical protein